MPYLDQPYQPQQHAEEFAEFIHFVRETGARSFLEIGSKFGGLLWAVAHAMPAASRLVSVDLPSARWGRTDSEKALTECVYHLGAEGYDASLILGNSADPKVVEAVRLLAPFDIVFIDADHTEEYVRKDFANYGRLARYCCFHDVGHTRPAVPLTRWPEVRKVWCELQETFRDQASFREIRYDDGINGIGIMRWL